MTALYRAYRPQRFDDVVGQDVVVRTLRNAIASGRVAHAYLFTGSKGTGKTTMAKLLAKSMNCVNGPTTDPCGVCESCVAIAEGRSIDVQEIDAASNNGVDAVREKIIETVNFQPAAGTKRVYILDEAHMLTVAAFNALLKTIEEPPDHVIFVFCTTETHKMMATVRDRCQRLVFAPATAPVLLEVLTRAAATEEIQADQRALQAIARVSQGSFRNALGTLELLSTSFNRQFSMDDVLSHLGVLSEDTMFEAVDAVLAADPARVLMLVEDLSQRGADLAQFVGALAEHLRALLLARHNVAGADLLVGDPGRLAGQAAAADEAQILATIDALGDALTRIRIGSDPRLALETSLVRACQGLGLSALALRIARLEQGATGSYGMPLAPPAPAAPAALATPVAEAAPAPVAPPVPVAAPVNVPTPAAVPVAAPAPVVEPPVMAAPEPVPPAAVAPPVPAEPVDVDADTLWSRLLAGTKGPVRAGLDAAQVLGWDGERLTIGTATPGMFTERLRGTVKTLVQEITGRSVAVDVRGVEAASASAPAVPAGAPAAAAPVPGAPPAEPPREDGPPLDSYAAIATDFEEVDGDVASNPAAAVPNEEAERNLSLLQTTFDATELTH